MGLRHSQEEWPSERSQPLLHAATTSGADTQGGLSFSFSQVTPCTVGKYYGQYILTGKTQLFARIEEACLCCDSSLELTECLAEAFEFGQQEWQAWEASYSAWTSRIKIHAVHLAASLGSIHVLDWLRLKLGPEVLGLQATITLGAETRLHYTPLHCAMFMSKTEACLWLLDQGVSPTVANNDGLSPFHMLAWNGLPHEPEETRLKALQNVAAKLVEKGADLGASSGELTHRTDRGADRFRHKIALELAAGKYSSYPKHMLHLLTQSFQCPAVSRLFEEVWIIAQANPTAAEVLLKKIQKTPSALLKERLRQEVLRKMTDGLHIEQFVKILQMAPVAGADLLKLLLAEPKVTNPQRYPLPLYAVLSNGEMVCAYQPIEGDAAPVWDGNSGNPPRWHADFGGDLPEETLRHTGVFEVRVRILHLPGVLNIRMLNILAMLRPSWDHMKIFAQIPVRAIVTCMWDQSLRSYYFSLACEVLLLLVLLNLGVCPTCVENATVAYMSLAVIYANLFFFASNATWGLVGCRHLCDMTKLQFLMSFAKRDIMGILILALMLRVDIDEPAKMGFQKVIIAANIIFRGLGLVTQLRVLPAIGPLIIAVLHSFVPMLGMFTLMAMVFMTFACAFITMKDGERPSYFVLLYLYQALFMTDSDGAEAISGLDVGHQQTLDFNVEMYTGSADPWLLGASTACMLFATAIFSLVLLNLTIGMYTKYYEQMQPFAQLIFQKQRAKECTYLMLHPRLPQYLIVDNPLAARYKRCIRGASALCFLFFLLDLWRCTSPLFGGINLALAALLYQAVLVFHLGNAGKAPQYLWVSYRDDYDEESYRDENDEIMALRKEQAEIKASARADMKVLKDGFQLELRALKDEIGEVLNVLKDNQQGPQEQLPVGAERTEGEMARQAGISGKLSKENKHL